MEQEEDLAIDPDVLHYANEQISARLGTLVYQVHAAAAQPKADTIHDLRVAIRRFLQSLEVFSSLLPKPAVKKIRKRLRRILNLSAAIRDRDIALELLSEAGLGKKEPLCRSVRSAGMPARASWKTSGKCFLQWRGNCSRKAAGRPAAK